MALAKGTSRMRTGPITLHTQTAIHVAEQLTKVTAPQVYKYIYLIFSVLESVLLPKDGIY